MGTSQVVLVVKSPPASAGDVRDVALFPGLGRSPVEGHGNPFQYSCLENPMDRGAWWAMVHRVAKSWILLKLLGIQKSKFVLLLFCFKLKFLKNLYNWRLITILWWFLSYIDMNQPWVYMYPTILNPLPNSLLTPSLWVVPEHQLWVPCFMHRICTGHLFYIW